MPYRSGKGQGINQVETNRWWEELNGTTTRDAEPEIFELRVLPFDAVTLVPELVSGGSVDVRLYVAYNEDGAPRWRLHSEITDLTTATDPKDATVHFTLYDTAVKSVRITVQPSAAGAHGTYRLYFTAPALKN